MKLIAKYIIIKEKLIPTPIIFSCNIIHSSMAVNKEVISAGFVEISCNNDINVKTYGESISLGIKSKVEDAEHIKKMFILPC